MIIAILIEERLLLLLRCVVETTKTAAAAQSPLPKPTSPKAFPGKVVGSMKMMTMSLVH
jgi:hypothetical protein